MAKVTTEKIPDLEAFKVTLKIVCVFVAPRFKEASLKDFGTLYKEIYEVLTIVGIIIIKRTKIAANKESPTTEEVEFLLKTNLIKGTIVVIPNSP